MEEQLLILDLDQTLIRVLILDDAREKLDRRYGNLPRVRRFTGDPCRYRVG